MNHTEAASVVHIPPNPVTYDKGKFTEVCVCRDCGSRGEKCYGIQSFGPCPECGSKEIGRSVGRYVGKHWQLRNEVPIQKANPAPIQPRHSVPEPGPIPSHGPIDIGPLTRSVERLEAIQTKISFVRARCHS